MNAKKGTGIDLLLWLLAVLAAAISWNSFAIGPPVQEALATAGAAQDQSIFQYLIAFFTSREAEIYGTLLFFGVVGMTGNYTMRWLRNEITGSLVNYMFYQHPRATLLAAVGIASELFAEVGLGIFTTEGGHFAGWSIVIVTALKSGYMGDSIANKGEPKAAGPDTVIAAQPGEKK